MKAFLRGLLRVIQAISRFKRSGVEWATSLSGEVQRKEFQYFENPTAIHFTIWKDLQLLYKRTS